MLHPNNHKICLLLHILLIMWGIIQPEITVVWCLLWLWIELCSFWKNNLDDVNRVNWDWAWDFNLPGLQDPVFLELDPQEGLKVEDTSAAASLFFVLFLVNYPLMYGNKRGFLCQGLICLLFNFMNCFKLYLLLCLREIIGTIQYCAPLAEKKM